MSERNSIVAQTAAKAAAELFRGTAAVPEMLGAIEQIEAKIFELTSKREGATQQVPQTMDQAAQNVTQQFPQAQVVSNPQPTVPQAQGSDGGVSDNEQRLWADLVNNPGNWYDNRSDGDTSISGGNKPDFRHREWTNQKGYKIGLYLVSRRFGRRAPDWVFQHFGLPIPDVTAQQQVPAATAPAPSAPPF